MVVFTHLAESIHVPSYSPGGFIGVLVFFVLSGYLITTICWRDDATWAADRKFVRRRIVRLMPVTALLVLVVSPLVVAWGGVEVHTAVVKTAVAAAQLTGLAVAAGMEWHQGGS